MYLNLLCSSESGLRSVPGSMLMTPERKLLFEEFCQFCAEHQQQSGDTNGTCSTSSSTSGTVNAIQLNAALNTCAVLQSKSCSTVMCYTYTHLNPIIEGDALLGFLQFDIVPGSDSISHHLSLQIHRAFVHPSHYRSKVCWRLIYYILELCLGIGAPLFSISITLPVGRGWIEQRVQQQLGFILTTTAAIQEGFIVYHYNLQDHVDGLQSILQYVQSRLTTGS